MIDRAIFLQYTALVADRIGRELQGPTQVEYHRQLSSALTTEQFVAAMTIVFNTWSAEYRTWPSPQQIIELIIPVAKPSLSALEAFELVLAAMSDARFKPLERRIKVQAMGAVTFRAFTAAGGVRDFAEVLEADVPWLRRRFVEAYEEACEHADAEQHARLALADADARVAGLVDNLAAVRSVDRVLPAPRRVS